MPDPGDFTIIAGSSDAGLRLDVTIARHIPDCSRSRAAILIRQAHVSVQGESRKPGYRVLGGDMIRVALPPPETLSLEPENIPLEILYEDEDLIVVNKPPGMVVHPAPGHFSGTLVNALLYHHPFLEGIGGECRPGIVHRLDKDTSGALVVAKNDRTHQHLSSQFKSRRIRKTYLALVWGAPDEASGRITLPIGRHPVERKRMAVNSRRGRPAETRWRVRERFRGLTLLEVDLKTGRTHQIRVHCAAMRHPIVGEPVYCKPAGRNRRLPEGAKQLAGIVKGVSRQMLHAWRLGFTHPDSGTFMSFEAPLAPDMRQLVEAVRQAAGQKIDD